MATTRARVTSLLVFWLAVVAVIMTSACTKKGGDAPPPAPPPQQAPPVPPGPPAQEPSAGGELDGDSSRSSQEGPNTSASPGESQLPAEVTHYDPTGLPPEKIYSNAALKGPSVLGKMSDVRDFSDTTLYYSGSGMDDLHEQIKAMLAASPNADERQANEEFAGRVSLIGFEIKDRTVKVAAVISRQGQRREIAFQGELDSNLRWKGGRLGSGPRISMEVACLDFELDKSPLLIPCQTAHIKLMDNNEGMIKTAHILARETRSALHTAGNGFNMSGNPEYERFLSILLHTTTGSGQPDTVASLRMITTEVINGTSTFLIRMEVRVGYSGKQIIGWTGPLVKPEKSEKMSLPIASIRTAVTPDSGAPLAHTIKGARLLRNDGRGNLQVELAIRAATPGAKEDYLTLTIARIHKPVRAPFL